MAKDPAFLFYSSDFLSGTMLMDDQQVGKYIRLLCLQHQKGKLAYRDVLKVCGSADDDILSKFQVDGDGMYYNERLLAESEKRKQYTESRRTNRNRADNSKVYVYVIRNHSNNQFKIGSSNNPKRRLIELKNQVKEDLSIVFYFGLVEQKVEADLHKKFKSKNAINEWFHLSDSDLDMIRHMYSHMIKDIDNHMIEHMEDVNENENKDLNKKEGVDENSKPPVTSKVKSEPPVPHPSLMYPVGFTHKFTDAWRQWIEYKYSVKEFRYKSLQTEQAAMHSLFNICKTEQQAIEIILYCISREWEGFYLPENMKENGQQQPANRNYSKPATGANADIQSGLNFIDAMHGTPKTG